MKLKLLTILLIFVLTGTNFAYLRKFPDLRLADREADTYICVNNKNHFNLQSEYYNKIKLNSAGKIQPFSQIEFCSSIIRNISSDDTSRYHRFYEKYNPKRNLLIPVAEVIAVNVGLSLFNNYVGDQPYAKITFESVKHNLDTGFVWDDDVFIVNQFGHPFHGGIYFNTARSTGHNFWESIPFAFGGSLMWELFMETDPPQTNDIIQTTIGGAMMGEMTHRISSLLLDESKRGLTRIFREIAAGIMNPSRAFNRLITGEMSRRTRNNVHDVFPIYNRINLGYAGINPTEQVKFEKKHIMFEYIFTYGNTFDLGIENPFDFFRIRFGFDARKGDEPSSWAYASGLLYGVNLEKKRDRKFILGVFHDYDFFYNQLYRLGAQSLGLGFIYFSPIRNKLKAIVGLHSNFIAMSALNSIYRKGPYRDYDYGIGNKTMLEGSLAYGPLSFVLEYRLYYMKTVNGFPGHSLFGFFNPKLLVDIYKGLGAGLEYIFYHRWGTFEGVADYSKRTSEQRLYLSYFF